MAKVDCVIALDTSDQERALAWVQELKGLHPEQTVFKVGLELFVSQGPRIVEKIRDQGARVLLDLKLHDIPTTVAKATKAASALGVNFLTVHAAGGSEMWRAACAEAGQTKLLAVTALTSFSETTWKEVYPGLPAIADTVSAWAKAAQSWGAHGWVCSAQELKLLPAGGYRLVPGIRLPGTQSNDQARVAAPAQAAQAGASGIVLGRSLLSQPNPVPMLQFVFDELRSV